jgi:hypothetical protein
MYNKVVITDVFNRCMNFNCKTAQEYRVYIKDHPDAVESIGKEGQLIKPIFDIDAYNTDIDIEAFKTDINNLYPNKEVNVANRESREDDPKKGMKYSYRVYVDGVKTTLKQINEALIDNDMYKKWSCLDKSIYDPNKVLYLPLTTIKKTIDNKTKKVIKKDVPVLMPNNCDIFKCCASYIEEDFEDYSMKNPVKQEIKEAIKQEVKEVIKDDEDDVIDTKYIINKISSYINKFKPERGSNYDSWTKMIWCIMNICNTNDIKERECAKLVHQFSKIGNNYDEDGTDTFFDDNYDKLREASYGWKYMYDCLKEDDEDFYNSINTKTYNTMKREFELTHAKILYPPMIVFNNCRKYETQKITSAKETYLHLKCKVSVFDKKSKKNIWETKPFFELWLKDANMRTYDKIVFKPTPLITSKNEFNIWDGFDIVNESLIKTERDFWEEYKTYVTNLLGDEKIANYVLARYAYRVVNPANRTSVVLVIYGGEGDGKNRLLSPIYKILGSYATSLDTAKKLYDTHSTYEYRKLFLVVNEAGGISNFENSDTLKARATEPTININPKGVQAYEIDNMCDYDMTTNNLNAVKITDDSTRRFLQIETTSYYRNNVEFFNDYIENIENNPIALRQIYEGLIKFDYKAIVPSLNFQDIRYKPASAINDEVKSANREKSILFLEDWVRSMKNANSKNEIELKNDTLFTDYKNWCAKGCFKDELNKQQFGMKISTLMKKQFIPNGFKCISKCLKHSKTTLNIDELVKYFKTINIEFA